MNMTIVELTQGTPEWHAWRATRFTASNAGAMMGASPYKSRQDLVREYATGEREEITPQKQRLFDRGHDAEEAARPMASVIVGKSLPAVVGERELGPITLGASFDGRTMAGRVIWENKLYSKDRAASIEKFNMPREDDWFQIQHQLLVSGAEECLYTLSNDDGEILESLTIRPDSETQERLLNGWNQFAADVLDYEAPEKAEEVDETPTPESLPTIAVKTTGMVEASNLHMIRDRLHEIVEAMPSELETEQDFADADANAKWLREKEKQFATAKEAILAQNADINDLINMASDMQEYCRKEALNRENAVKRRKKQLRDDADASVRVEFEAHIAQLEKTFGGKIRMPAVATNFAEAGKGKRTIDTYRDALKDALAAAKLEANAIADKIRLNLETLRGKAEGFEFLFADAQQLVLKDNDDLAAIITARIAEHKAMQAQAKPEEKTAEPAQEEQKEMFAKPKPVATGSLEQDIGKLIHSINNARQSIEWAELSTKAGADLAKKLNNDLKLLADDLASEAQRGAA